MRNRVIAEKEQKRGAEEQYEEGDERTEFLHSPVS